MNKGDLEKVLQDVSDELELSEDQEIIDSLGKTYIHYQLVYMKKYGADFRPERL